MRRLPGPLQHQIVSARLWRAVSLLGVCYAVSSAAAAEPHRMDMKPQRSQCLCMRHAARRHLVLQPLCIAFRIAPRRPMLSPPP